MEEGVVPIVIVLTAILFVWALVRITLWLMFRRAAASLGLTQQDVGVASFPEILGVKLFGGAVLKRHAYASPSQEGFYVVYQNIGGPMSRAVSVYQTPYTGPRMAAVVGKLQGGTPLPASYQGRLHGGLHLFGGASSVLSALAEDHLLQKWAAGSQLSFQANDGMLYVFSPGNFALGTRLISFAEGARSMAQHLSVKYGHNHSLQARRP